MFKLEADEGEGAVFRVWRRLSKWQVTGPRFRDTPELRAALAVVHYDDLKARQMVI
jgi:hypothetical protein